MSSPLLQNDFLSRNIQGDESQSSQAFHHSDSEETADVIVEDQLFGPGTFYANANNEDQLIQSTSSSLGFVLHVYPSRWYILIVYSVLAFLQGALGSVWSVIAPSVEIAFQWSDRDVSLMQAWLYISFLVSMFPFAILMDKKGLRIPVILTAFLLVIGSALRCISTNPPYVTWLAHFGHIFIGLAGPVAFTAGPVISSLWFPVHQRGTATAIATIAGYAGGAACFLFGPMLVDAPLLIPIDPNSGSLYPIQNATNIDWIKHEIIVCRYIECGVCALIFLMVLIYFPSAPPSSPTLTAAIGKLELGSGLKQLFSRENANFWLICLPYGISVSIYGVWNGLLGVNLKHLVTESDIGWLGFSAVSCGCVTAILLGRLSDLFVGRMKHFVLIFNVGFILSTFWFILLAQGYITFSKVQLFVAGCLQGLFNNGAVPLYYELAIENTYPVAEVCNSTIMTFVYNCIPLFFLIIFLIPNVGTTWMNWVLYGAGILSFPLILSFKEKYKRMMVDKYRAPAPASLQNSLQVRAPASLQSSIQR